MASGVGYRGYWWGNVRERFNLGNPDPRGRIILRYMFMNWELVLWTLLIWLGIGTGVGHL